MREFLSALRDCCRAVFTLPLGRAIQTGCTNGPRSALQLAAYLQQLEVNCTASAIDFDALLDRAKLTAAQARVSYQEACQREYRAALTATR
jgi:hypothetical protein